MRQIGAFVTPSNFTANLLALNRTRVYGFKKWLFAPGMAYGDTDKWWAGKTGRATRHEGLDFAAYLDKAGRERRLGAGLVVPPLYPGRPIKVMDDFLGRTVVIDHRITDQRGRILHGFYAHLAPASHLEPGKVIAETAELGTIAPANRACAPHLHISTVWIAPRFSIEELSWARFREANDFQPCDPLDFLAIPRR